MLVFLEKDMDVGSAYVKALAAESPDRDIVIGLRLAILKRLHLASYDVEAVPDEELVALFETIQTAAQTIQKRTFRFREFEDGVIDTMGIQVRLLCDDRDYIRPLRNPANRVTLVFLADPDRSPEYSLEEILAGVPTTSEQIVRHLIERGCLFASINTKKRLDLIRLTNTGQKALALAKHLLPLP